MMRVWRQTDHGPFVWALVTLLLVGVPALATACAKYRDVVQDLQGNVVPGTTITVYRAGTTSLATLYTDNTCTTTAANPFTNDLTGVYQFYAKPGRYDIVPSRSGYTFAANRDIFLPDDAAMTGVTDVRAFGAVGDGVTNDTAAIQAAINAAAADDRRGIVWFPPGTYRVSQLTLTGKPVTLKGSAERGTFIRGDGTGHIIYANNATEVTGIVIEDLNIGFSPAQATYDAVNLTNVGLFAINRAGFGGARYGVNLALNARMGTITNSIFGSTNQTGLFLGPGANHMRVIGNWFDENVQGGIRTNQFNDSVIVGNNFLDNSGTHLIIDGLSNDNVVAGNVFIAGTQLPTAIAIRVFNGSRNTIASNVIDTFTSNDIIIDSAATSTRLVFNQFKRQPPSILNSGAGTTILGQGDNQSLLPDGTVSAPGISFSNEPDSGLFRSSFRNLRLSVGGVENVLFTTSGQVLFSGRVRLPLSTAAALPAAADGELQYCTDCALTNPCAGGGTGALAVRQRGVWRCDAAP
jgi:hypothetical protein